MVEWKVLEDETLPEEIEQPRRRPLWRRGFLVVLLVAGLLLIGYQGLRQLAEAREARLREDIERAVGQEEYAHPLVDPAAPPEWIWRYQNSLGQVDDGPAPEVESIEYDQNVALVTVRYRDEDTEWRAVRSYRHIAGEWRRTPTPVDRWGETSAHRSPHFTLWMGDRDASVLPPGELLAFLEQFRSDFGALWPLVLPDDSNLTIRIIPQELYTTRGEPLRARWDEREIIFNSPLVTRYEESSDLPPPALYRTELAASVASVLDHLHSRGRPFEGSYVEDSALRSMLRHAVARNLVLDRAELPDARGE
jgi:hypothetical protein